MDPGTEPIGQGHLVRTTIRGIGQLMITVGIVLLLFVLYELWWTGFTTKHDQKQLLSTIHREWAHGQSTTEVHGLKGPKLGTGIAILRIPRLGKHYLFVVVQGTSTDDLIKGPGHYADTAMPGQLGNFSVAGHRTTYLHPFYDINHLRVGDAIVLETSSMWFTYRVQDIPGTSAKHREIVSPSDVSVAYAVPDQPNPARVPDQRALTFTSCNPRYSASQRIVIHALLSNARPKTLGPPPVLAGYPRLGD